MEREWGWRLCSQNSDGAVFDGSDAKCFSWAFYIVQIDSILDSERNKLTIQIRKLITLGALQLLAQLLVFFMCNSIIGLPAILGINLKCLLAIAVSGVKWHYLHTGKTNFRRGGFLIFCELK